MRKETLQGATGFLAGRRRRRTWKKVVSVLACIVVFCTTYALILPAITMEKTPGCGKTEHIHSEACDTRVTSGSRTVPVCTLESLGLHQHTDDCLEENGEYCCGYSDFVVHQHDDVCYDENGNLWCPLSQVEAHTHDESCYAQPECICSKAEIILHEHHSDCLDEGGNLICGKQQVLEHVHTEACFQTVEEPAPTDPLTCDLEEHTHSAACRVIGLIEALPARQSVEERVAALEEAGNDAGGDDYLSELQTQVREVYEDYAALPEEEQAKVTNVNRLTELDWLRGLSLQETAAVTVQNADHSSASVASWTDDTGAVQERLQAALFTVDQGYTIRSAAHYRIAGLTGGKAVVTYHDGGLSAANGAKVFVYDLGADGTAAPKSCAVEDPTLEEQTGLFTSFCFEIPAESEGASHIYAFLSASPATLEEMGIYLGQEQPDGTWVAYDGATPENANIKAAITLPDGAMAPEGYRLFIRKINEGERFYPGNEAVRAKAGAFNGWQCYTIRWITQNADGSLKMLPLNEIGTTTVEINYLKDDAKLPGPEGARKLLIYNSNADGSLVDQVADSVENVRVAGDHYESFTFHAAQTGPYVFVSKKLEMGYISSLQIAEIIDGSKPFDNSDVPGNDSGPGNNIVRSYDTIQYNLAATFAARQEGVTANEVDMYFELTLRKSATAARFDVSKMLWLGENYSIEYLDNDGNVIMVMAYDGKYYLPQTDESGAVLRNENGFALANTGRPVSVNAQVNGSTSGGSSYKVTSGGVAMQRLVGWTTLRANEGESILSGTQSFSTAVEVRNADNGETFAPAFRMWLEGNEENYGEETASPEGGLAPAQPDTDNAVDVNDEENARYRVTVSAGTNFNLRLRKNNDMSYKDWFDFSTGQGVAEPTRSELVRLANLPENRGKSNPAQFTEHGAALSAERQEQYANYRYGRMTCYGITLQLYNDTDNDPEKNRDSKGFRGLSLPVGDITFDLNFSSTAKAGTSTITSEEYTPILWDYNENVPAITSYTNTYVDPGRGTVTTPKDGKGNGGRNLYWDGESRSHYAKGGAPGNYISCYEGCYYGGDWTLVDGNGNKADIQTVANPRDVTGTGAATTYHFSVRDYDFDFDNQHFPTKDAGNSGDVPGYNTYAWCFSAGCVQVLSVFPMVQKVSEAEIFLNTTLSNLQLTTRAGQRLEPKVGDATKIQHEVNKDDNITRDQIVLYAPGGLTKGNSFNGIYGMDKREPTTCATGFLGTEYWTTSYDCSAFAGDDIWIVSYGMISAGSDYRTRSMNLLQLFDSRALTVRGEPQIHQDWDEKYDQKGEVTFLYAADPDYRNGYDTNHRNAKMEYDVLAYMNTVREEDLVYYTSLEALQKDGYTCVGVLMELRDCNLLCGKYQYVRIPVKVNGGDPDLVGKTVATVNMFRVWSENLGTMSWANGKWDHTTGKNLLEGFPMPTNSLDGKRYSGELANGGGFLADGRGSPPEYVKTEYQDNLQVQGTHAGGTLSGNSLLILSYKAGINIGVDNKASAGMISYNLGNGETVVNYRLKNIRTEVSDLTSQTVKPVTDLTIHAVLDEGHTGSTQRIFVSGGTYRITGYAVDANGKVAKEQTRIAIGTDPVHPAVLEFEGSDQEMHRIKIYAQMGRNNQSVKFVIQDAPVGIQLPDITFQANFAAITALRNNDTIKTSTYISGQGDNRAYSQAKGNTDNITVGIVMRSGTNLTKDLDMDTQCIELNGVISYKITYTNSGTERIDKVYFYDLLPKSGDIRGSVFDGRVVLRSVGIESDNAIVYYSTTEYWELYNTVKVFGGKMDDQGTVSGMSTQAVEEMLANGQNAKGEPLFRPLGQVTGGVFGYDSALSGMSNQEKIELMRTVTGLYVKAEGLQTGQTITLRITVETEDNKADDWYKNIANSWIAGSATLPLTSNKVETQTVSRSISGVVWHDRDLDGVRDDDEQRLPDVTATLFKIVNGAYVRCTEDVTGREISPVTTGPDGVYSFDKLGPGDYIVAFSGLALEEFTGATAYQQNGRNDADTNDGKAVSRGRTKAFDLDGYAYYIQYSLEGQSIPLHGLEEIGTVHLVNGVEAYANQDLGLVKATHELPQTGGAGTARYTVGGILIACVSLFLLLINKKRRKGDFAAS